MQQEHEIILDRHAVVQLIDFKKWKGGEYNRVFMQ